MAGVAERLTARLRAEGITVPDGCRIRRTHAGWAQRASGAWSWWLEDRDGREVAAGFEAATVLLRAASWTVSPAPDTVGVVEIDRAT